MGFGDCFKKKNTSAAGTTQPPAHPSNDSTPVEVPTTPPSRVNFFEKYAYDKVSAFEGSGIDMVSDNFDGQGISLGGFQWCVGQGSLQEKILKPYFAHNEPSNEVERVLKQISTSSISKGLSLCKENFLSGTKLKSAEKVYLKAFAIKAEAYQLSAGKEIFNRAWGLCDSSGLTSLKAFCFFVDVCVQNGSMDGVAKPIADVNKYKNFIANEGGVNKKRWQALTVDSETIVLCLWIAARAKQNKWRSDVISRKCTIAHGVGIVHDELFEFPEFKEA